MDSQTKTSNPVPEQAWYILRFKEWSSVFRQTEQARRHGSIREAVPLACWTPQQGSINTADWWWRQEDWVRSRKQTPASERHTQSAVFLSNVPSTLSPWQWEGSLGQSWTSQLCNRKLIVVGKWPLEHGRASGALLLRQVRNSVFFLDHNTDCGKTGTFISYQNEGGNNPRLPRFVSPILRSTRIYMFSLKMSLSEVGDLSEQVSQVHIWFCLKSQTFSILSFTSCLSYFWNQNNHSTILPASPSALSVFP